MSFGIEALNVYGGVAAIPVSELFTGRGLDQARFGNLQMTARSVALPFEDPVTNAANAARPILDQHGVEDIELLVTCTESGVDYSKSLASYLHRQLGLSNRCRLLEVKQACYSATAALQLSVGHLAGRAAPGAKALVIATDVAVVGAEGEYAEPATGSGAVAMLVGEGGQVLSIDPGAYGLHSFDTFDSARPLPDRDVVDVDQSMMSYLGCAKASVADYLDRVAGADLGRTFDHLVMHTPFAGMVKAAHRALMREHDLPDVAGDFERRVQPSLLYPGLIGNLFSGSVYAALASLIDTVQPDRDLRVGLYSYGSGCSSEFYSGLIGAESSLALKRMGIEAQLAGRYQLDFAEYLELLPAARACLQPLPVRDIDVSRYLPMARAGSGGRPLLALTGVRDFRRQYEWID